VTYLKNQTLASAPALFVICRYLAHHPSGASMDRLQKALAPPGVLDEVGRAGRSAGVPPVLPDSLAVGIDIELLDVEGVRDQRVWTLRKEYTRLLRDLPSVGARAFRSLLLRKFGTRALRAVESGEEPPDVPYALTWLLTLDPLSPMESTWDHGPREAFEQAGMRAAVYNPEQWRPFLRWAEALGLVNEIPASGKLRVVVDPTRAIDDVLDEMPTRASTREWFDQLYAVQPLLGDPRLISALPVGSAVESGPSAAVTLALTKLEHRGRIRLVEADDTTDAAVLRLGGLVRRVARIEAGEKVA
jgi:hypothetical protein